MRQDKLWFKLFKLSRKLRRQKFDLLIDFQNNRRSHFLAFLSLAKERYGYDNKKWSFFLTHLVLNKNPNLPPVDHQFQLLSALGIKQNKLNYIELWPTKKR